MPDCSIRWSKRLSVVAGLSDGSTGIGLLLAPLFTLQAMGIDEIPADLVFIRYIGAFVLSAGLAYGIPFLAANRDALHAGIRTVFQVTAIVRILVSGVCTYGLLAHQLDPAWISVPLYDGTMALFQLLLLHKELRT